MKKLFTFLFAPLLAVMCICLAGHNVQAQTIYEIDTVVLDPTDFSGEYVLKTSNDLYMLPFEDGGVSSSQRPMAKLVISPVPSVDDQYYLQWNDLYMNFTHGWNLGFSAAEENNTWEIIYDDATNTIKLSKSTSDQLIKFENGSFYHDSSDPNHDVTFELWEVTGSQTVVTPEPELKGLSDVTLDADDLSGNYVIQFDATNFMGFNEGGLVTATTEPQFAFDLVKQEDGSYIIQAEDWAATYAHGWQLQFGVNPEQKNTWLVNVVDGDTVTIQRNDGTGGKYIKIENGSFFTDAGTDADIKFRLRGVADPSSPNLSVLSDLIVSAEELFSGAVAEDYEDGAFDTFSAAIDYAKAVEAGTEITQDDVDTEVTSLNAAIEAFNAAKIMAPAQISTSPASLTFDDTNVGESKQITFTISNDGESTLEVSGITAPAGFSVDVTSTTIAGGESEIVTVTFSPTDAMVYNGDISISSNVGDETILVSGEGIEPTVGVEDELASAIKLYPNPVEDKLNINWGGLTLSGKAPVVISGLDGREYVNYAISTTNEMKIEVSNLPKGLYLIRIKTVSGETTKKFIKL